MSVYELTLVVKEKAKVSPPGKIKSSKDWGSLDLAYPIGGEKRAKYLYFELELDPAEIVPMNKLFGQNENVLRHLLICKE